MTDKTAFQSKKRILRSDFLFFGSAILMGAVIIGGLHGVIELGKHYEETVIYKQMITILGMIFSFILFIGCRFNNRESAKQKLFFSTVSVLLFAIIFLAGMADISDTVSIEPHLLFFIETLACALVVIAHLMIWYYQCASLPKNRTQKIFSLWFCFLAVLYGVVLVINIFTGILFYVDSSAHLVWTGSIFDYVLICSFYISYLLYLIPLRCPWQKKIAVGSFAVMPMAGIATLFAWKFVGIRAVLLTAPYIFLLLAVYVVFFCDYKSSQDRLLEQNAELAEQKRKQTEMQTALMLSQIQPHFLYNSITAIRNLCKNDPEEAYTALGRFSDYLRGNMDALGDGRMITFDKELEHIKTYTLLEQMRFGDDLTVDYDIRYTDFFVPALTVQPIVENAVRHGAIMKESGGTVTVRAEKTNDGAVVTVTDNGPGFDPDTLPDDGRSHVGISNVRGRLTSLNCGELTVESTPGAGTVVTIHFRRNFHEYSAR